MAREKTIVLTEISKDTKLRQLIAAFAGYELTAAKVTVRNRNNKPTRLGFVTFEDEEEAKKVMKNEKMTIDGAEVSLAYAKSKNVEFGKSKEIKNKLHVSNIPAGVSEDELSKLLGNCKIIKPVTAKGYCFAEYDNEEQKDKAVSEFNATKDEAKHPLTLAPAIEVNNNRRIFKRRPNYVKRME